MTTRPADPRLTFIAAAGLIVLTLVGVGLYRLVPLTGPTEDDAAAVVESYVRAWGEKRCEDAVELIDGPREKVLAACAEDAVTEELELGAAQVELDGDRGTASLTVHYRENGKDKVRDVVEQLVRVDGEWKVVWRRR